MEENALKIKSKNSMKKIWIKEVAIYSVGGIYWILFYDAVALKLKQDSTNMNHLIVLAIITVGIFILNAFSHEKVKLIEENQRYRQAIEGSQASLWEWDGSFFNESGRVQGKWSDHIYQEDIQILEYKLEQCVKGDYSQFDCEHRVLDGNGNIRWVATRGKVIKCLEQSNLKIIGMSFDITERRSHELKLHEMALKDSLTGLLNRAAFSERIHAFIGSVKETDKKAVLLFLDLDDFKAVNDTWGHDVGDAFLVETAIRLRSCVRGKDSIARLGGDEFAILIDDIEQLGELEGIIGRIQMAFEKPFMIANRVEYISISIGSATLHEDGITAETLMKCADMDMYHSKRVNRLKQGAENE